MRISDWSSDVCSSDLIGIAVLGKDQCHLGQCLECIFDVELHRGRLVDRGGWNTKVGDRDVLLVELRHELLSKRTEQQDRQSVVSGKSVSVRVDLGGRRLIKKNKIKSKNTKNK